jgi:purine-nucleoside phosphorylase
VEVLAMQGRVHAYEGHDLQTVVLPVRALVGAGCQVVLLTNAAGGVGEGLAAGDLVLIRDHLNLVGGSPLRGENDPALGPRFPDMTAVYDPRLRRLAEQVAARLSLRLPSGVYACSLGPQYETPAEVRMLRTLGADLVGMSTVPEAIAARHMGARVLGISCVTNLAAGISAQPLSHDEVTETAERVRGVFISLLDGILAAIGRELGGSTAA